MRTRAKICGITRSQDIQAVVNAGADAIGFVFFPPSPRHVSAAQAKELIQHVPAYVQTVGLFVNATAADIVDVLKQVALDIIQFHGDETPEDCQAIAAQGGYNAKISESPINYNWCSDILRRVITSPLKLSSASSLIRLPLKNRLPVRQ